MNKPLESDLMKLNTSKLHKCNAIQEACEQMLSSETEYKSETIPGLGCVGVFETINTIEARLKGDTTIKGWEYNDNTKDVTEDTMRAFRDELVNYVSDTQWGECQRKARVRSASSLTEVAEL